LRGGKNDPLIGTVFAERYDIQSFIGLGGMSVVYKARHRLMDRLVAIKMLHSDMKSDRVSLERFKMEAQAASALNHQNIVSVYDFGVTPEGDAFFVMDFLDGESLGDLINRKGRVPWERALGIFKQICDGLGAAHKRSIVHRDLKPDNVILVKQDDGSELVKLVDFGIAKLLPGSGKEQQNLTKTGEVFGSPIYMSPEQCLGKELDNRSDIYALGCLMYQTLAGEPPFLGSGFLETLNKHVGEKPKSIAEFAADANVPPALDQIVLRCLAKEPGQRFQLAEDVRDHLSAISASLSITGAQRGAVSGPHTMRTGGATVQTPNCKPAYKNGWIIAGALSVLTMVVAFAFVALSPGPVEDRGTPLNKLFWTLAMDHADDAFKRKQFDQAEHELRTAESIAKGLGDGDVRLEKTLRKKAVLYGTWEAHAELLEETNTEITNLQIKRLKTELQNQLDSLTQLEQTPPGSAVALSSTKLTAEADIPSLITTSAKLYGARLYLDQTRLLEKAIKVDKKFLGNDSVPLTKLECALAEAYVALRKYNEVRPLLAHVCEVRKPTMDSAPAEYVRALDRLGQFDLDQNELKEAEQELTESLKLAKQKHVERPLLITCLRNYADLLSQTKRKQESLPYLKEANALESQESK